MLRKKGILKTTGGKRCDRREGREAELQNGPLKNGKKEKKALSLCRSRRSTGMTSVEKNWSGKEDKLCSKRIKWEKDLNPGEGSGGWWSVDVVVQAK